ncbi:MAG TPA: hypothetical protein VHW23_40125 [Kofleriaceae bacterium]|jgi:hypothetical protein|nr:hypothetical protein [Kofleriaceae bacterium]
MTQTFESIDAVALTQVSGGEQKQPSQPQPKPSDQTQWIKNTVKCTRIGGPLLGAACGILTPSPAY